MSWEYEHKYKGYLKDCGCDERQIEEYLGLLVNGSIAEQIFFLKRHRNKTLEEIHSMNRQIDCIDYVIHELEQSLD